MLFAREIDGSRRLRASPGLTAVCPGCHAPVLAKCGSILTWHWSHRGAANDCSNEPETEWHRWWKSKAPDDWTEVEMGGGAHRADVRRDDDLVIEFQHSLIDARVIAEREEFYGSMCWVVDLQAAQHHFRFRDAEGGEVRFQWAHGRRSWATSTKPRFFDLGDRVLEVLTLAADATTGTGRIVSVDDFLRWARLAPLTPRERATPVRYQVTRSNARTTFLRREDFGGGPLTSTHYDRDGAVKAALTESTHAAWLPIPTITFEGGEWRTAPGAPVHLRSFASHAIDITIVTRSGRRQTLRHDLATLERDGNRLALRYRFGAPLDLFARVLPRVCKRISTAAGPRSAFPMLRPVLVPPAGPRPRCPPARPAPKPRLTSLTPTATGYRWALPLIVDARPAYLRPLCPPPPRPTDLEPVRERGRWGRIVPEPTNNVFGHLKVLRRTDDRFVVLDPDGPLSTDWPIFDLESEARQWAARAAEVR